MNNQPTIYEEELKNRVAALYFGKYYSAPIVGGWGFHFVSNSTPYMTTWRTYIPAEASAMVVDGSIVTNAVFARNATAMFNPSATQDAQWETLAKYIPAVSTAAGKIPTLIGSENRNDINAIRYRSSWGRPAVENEQPWLHSDMKDMAYFFINALYEEITTNGGMK